jgi:hypothetical protein
MFPSLILEKHDSNIPAVKSIVEQHIFNHMTSDGWSNEFAGFVTLHLDTVFDPLFKFASDAVKDYVTSFNVDPNDFEFHIVKSWANIVKNRGNPTHDHADAHVSFVYYVNIPADVSTPIIFYNHPNRYEPFHGLTRWNSKSWDILNSGTWQFMPKEGEILVFPSGMGHETPRLSDIEDVGVKDLTELKKHRISIAGDVIITYKELAAKPLGLQPVKNWRTF